MGLSFHDEPSLVEAVGSLEYDDLHSIPTIESISEDGNLRIEPHDPTAEPGMINIEEERRDDDIGRSDNIQMVDT